MKDELLILPKKIKGVITNEEAIKEVAYKITKQVIDSLLVED